MGLFFEKVITLLLPPNDLVAARCSRVQSLTMDFSLGAQQSQQMNRERVQ